MSDNIKIEDLLLCNASVGAFKFYLLIKRKHPTCTNRAHKFLTQAGGMDAERPARELLGYWYELMDRDHKAQIRREWGLYGEFN